VAIETAPAFVTTTVNGYTIRTTTTSSPLSHTNNSLVSTIILPSADAIENKKIIMGLDIKVAFARTATLKLEASHNGTDWIVLETLDASVSYSTGIQSYLVDLTGVYTPNFRFHYNTSGLAVGTSGTLQFFFAYK